MAEVILLTIFTIGVISFGGFIRSLSRNATLEARKEAIDKEFEEGTRK
jgi:hypothetical protein